MVVCIGVCWCSWGAALFWVVYQFGIVNLVQNQICIDSILDWQIFQVLKSCLNLEVTHKMPNR
jgi:hypothetical protein